MGFTGIWLTGLIALASPAPTTPPQPGGLTMPSRSTPPEQALAMLQDILRQWGGKEGFDADYGQVNSTLLKTLADAIDLVESAARQPTDDPSRLAVLLTWRQENQGFVRQLATDSGQLRDLTGQPLRHRLAERVMYERIVAAVRRNAAVLRELAGVWEEPVSGMP